MQVILASDHAGIALRKSLVSYVQTLGYPTEDLGTFSPEAVDYPDYAQAVCARVRQHSEMRGILICGTGVGMSIAANKVSGIRCALVQDSFTAKRAREHNDTNVLALGQQVVGLGVAEDIVATWLATPFSGGERHCRRLEKAAHVTQDAPLSGGYA